VLLLFSILAAWGI
jgi:hypothetical protein